MAANDNSFSRRAGCGELVRVGACALNRFEPRASSVLSLEDQKWFAVRDAVAAFLAEHTTGSLGIVEFRRAKMVADHLVVVDA